MTVPKATLEESHSSLATLQQTSSNYPKHQRPRPHIERSCSHRKDSRTNLSAHHDHRCQDLLRTTSANSVALTYERALAQAVPLRGSPPQKRRKMGLVTLQVRHKK